jgi:hypothetical protein
MGRESTWVDEQGELARKSEFAVFQIRSTWKCFHLVAAFRTVLREKLELGREGGGAFSFKVVLQAENC